jgi:hypothetical protein
MAAGIPRIKVRKTRYFWRDVIERKPTACVAVD